MNFDELAGLCSYAGQRLMVSHGVSDEEFTLCRIATEYRFNDRKLELLRLIAQNISYFEPSGFNYRKYENRVVHSVIKQTAH